MLRYLSFFIAEEHDYHLKLPCPENIPFRLFKEACNNAILYPNGFEYKRILFNKGEIVDRIVGSQPKRSVDVLLKKVIA